MSVEIKTGNLYCNNKNVRVLSFRQRNVLTTENQVNPTRSVGLVFVRLREKGNESSSLTRNTSTRESKTSKSTRFQFRNNFSGFGSGSVLLKAKTLVPISDPVFQILNTIGFSSVPISIIPNGLGSRADFFRRGPGP